MLALLQNSIPVDGNALGTGPCNEPFGHSTWDATHSFFVRLVCCELAAELGKVLYESPAGGALTQMCQKTAGLLFWYLPSGRKAAQLFIIGVGLQLEFPPALLCAER